MTSAKAHSAILKIFEENKFKTQKSPELESEIFKMVDAIEEGDKNLNLYFNDEQSEFYSFGFGSDGKDIPDRNWVLLFNDEILEQADTADLSGVAIANAFKEVAEETAKTLKNKAEREKRQAGGIQVDESDTQTLIVSFIQKVDRQIDRINSKKQEIARKISKLKALEPVAKSEEEKQKIIKQIAEEEKKIQLYPLTLEFLEEKKQNARQLDAYLDPEITDYMSEDVIDQKIKEITDLYSKSQREHRLIMLKINNITWKSESRIASQAELKDDDYSWLSATTSNDQIIEKIKDLQKFFYVINVNASKYKGQIARDFKNQLKQLISRIKNKKIEKEAIESIVNKLIEKKSQIELLKDYFADQASEKNTNSHVIKSNVEQINKILNESEELNETSLAIIQEKINTIKSVLNDPNKLIWSSTRKKIDQLSDLLVKDQITIEDLGQLKDKFKNLFETFKQKISELKTSVPAFVSEPQKKAFDVDLITLFERNRQKFNVMINEILDTEEAKIIKKEILIQSYVKSNAASKLTRTTISAELAGKATKAKKPKITLESLTQEINQEISQKPVSERTPQQIKEEREKDIADYISKIGENETLILQDFNVELNKLVSIILNKSEQLMGLGGEAAVAVESIQRGKKYEIINKALQEVMKIFKTKNYNDLINDNIFHKCMEVIINFTFFPGHKSLIANQSIVHDIYLKLFKTSEIDKYENESSIMEMSKKIKSILDGIENTEDKENKKSELVSALNDSSSKNYSIISQAIKYDRENMPTTIYSIILNKFKDNLQSLIGESNLAIFRA